MKNAVITVLVIAVLVTGYLAASSLRMDLESVQGKTERIIVGDLTLPINATGEVRPARRVEIKAEASGEVVTVRKQPGDRVKAGEIIIQLNRDNEHRNVTKAELDVKTATARHEEAKTRLKLAKGPDLDSAKAKVGQLSQVLRLSKYRKEKFDALELNLTNEEELLRADVTYEGDLAQLADAEARYERAKLSIPLAEQALAQSAAALEKTNNVLDDAKRVLTETEIIAPINGIIGDVYVEVGDVIQGGKTTLTGGTVLASVVDMDRLIVEAEVDESDIERVLAIAPAWSIPGRAASDTMPDDISKAMGTTEHAPVITVESFRDQEFTGVIELIKPEPRMLSGVVTYTVNVIVTSANRGLLLQGMRADVRFTSEHIENVRLCPNEAIREGPNGGLGVYVPKSGTNPKDRETEFVTCKFGLSNGNYSHVLCDTLAEGTTIYTQLPRAKDSG